MLCVCKKNSTTILLISFTIFRFKKKIYIDKFAMEKKVVLNDSCWLPKKNWRKTCSFFKPLLVRLILSECSAPMALYQAELTNISVLMCMLYISFSFHLLSQGKFCLSFESSFIFLILLKDCNDICWYIYLPTKLMILSIDCDEFCQIMLTKVCIKDKKLFEASDCWFKIEIVLIL